MFRSKMALSLLSRQARLRALKIPLALASARRFESTLVETEEDGKIFFVSIARPEKRNAVNAETAKQLSEAFRAFENHDECSVAVFFGKGGSFCAGYDLQELSERDPEKFLKSVPPVGEGDAPMVSKVSRKVQAFSENRKQACRALTFDFQKSYGIKVFVPFLLLFLSPMTLFIVATAYVCPLMAIVLFCTSSPMYSCVLITQRTCTTRARVVNRFFREQDVTFIGLFPVKREACMLYRYFDQRFIMFMRACMWHWLVNRCLLHS